jgi:hypothetical protein
MKTNPLELEKEKIQNFFTKLRKINKKESKKIIFNEFEFFIKLSMDFTHFLIWFTEIYYLKQNIFDKKIIKFFIIYQNNFFYSIIYLEHFHNHLKIEEKIHLLTNYFDYLNNYENNNHTFQRIYNKDEIEIKIKIIMDELVIKKINKNNSNFYDLYFLFKEKGYIKGMIYLLIKNRKYDDLIEIYFENRMFIDMLKLFSTDDEIEIDFFYYNKILNDLISRYDELKKEDDYIIVFKSFLSFFIKKSIFNEIYLINKLSKNVNIDYKLLSFKSVSLYNEQNNILNKFICENNPKIQNVEIVKIEKCSYCNNILDFPFKLFFCNHIFHKNCINSDFCSICEK